MNQILLFLKIKFTFFNAPGRSCSVFSFILGSLARSILLLTHEAAPAILKVYPDKLAGTRLIYLAPWASRVNNSRWSMNKLVDAFSAFFSFFDIASGVGRNSYDV